jgi:bifunctional non-homologous end joining protein LigD
MPTSGAGQAARAKTVQPAYPRVSGQAITPPSRHLPAAIEPMLARTSPTPFDSRSHIFELLWDGIRAMAFVESGALRLQDRYGRDVTRRYPELGPVGRGLPSGTALDGVIVALDGEGAPDFARLRRRLCAADERECEKLAVEIPVMFQAFDILYAEGRPLFDCTLLRRKEMLAQMPRPRAALAVPDYIPVDGIAFFEAARQRGLEGIVGKKWESRYQPGRRTTAWQKVKVYQKREFVIGGFTYAGRSRGGGRAARPFYSLLVGLYGEGGDLRYAGEVTGDFGEEALGEVAPVLDGLASQRCPFQPAPAVSRLVFWCRPELAATIRFSEWGPGRRVRFPVFEGLRPDMPAGACRVEEGA